jgi:glutamate 5-kinase
MRLYAEVFARYGRKVAQLLLTRDDMEDRRRYRNARYTLDMLYEMGVVPIINENDTVTIDELKFGDNDMLSAIVAAKLEADLLVLLTVVDGLFDASPKRSKDANLIPVVERVTTEIKRLVYSGKSTYGSGGMESKLESVEYAGLAGIPSIIAHGKKRAILSNIFSGTIDGTLFLPRKCRRLSARERWIAFGKIGGGRKLILDKGACEALVSRGKSLLAVGISKVVGDFKRGDVVQVCNQSDELLGKGLVNYSSEEIRKIKGSKSSEIQKILGYMDYDEVVHRDNFVLLIDT